MTLNEQIARVVSVRAEQVETALLLLADDHTVPFLARYRKERTGGLDEVQLFAIQEAYDRLTTLEKRRSAIEKSLREQGVQDARVWEKLKAASTLVELEDLYLPYRPKRKTRGSLAREAGYEPVAKWILRNRNTPAPDPSWDEVAWKGGRDIVAELIADHAGVRSLLREGMARTGQLMAILPRGYQGTNPYQHLVGSSGNLQKVPSHRLLALLRGQREEHLRLEVVMDDERAVSRALEAFGYPGTAQPQLLAAMQDAWKMLVQPSLENEALESAREAADEVAIAVFARNLQDLLLASPLGSKPLLALDPGFRTGTKAAVLDSQGNLVSHGVLYALEPQRQVREAEAQVRAWFQKPGFEAIAVGNGTGGREMLEFIEGLGLGIPVVSVNESGASVYSASEWAREEFPDLDLTVRGAVSIGRRLLDPLAELVKIDPKAIGVGQYQHDVDQKRLKKRLDDVVVSCVNQVGVDLNTATPAILRYVSGLNASQALNVVEHRRKLGGYRSREQLKGVKGLGPKAFEQSAGFLRVRGGTELLDASAVHPESYPVVEQIAQKLGRTVSELIGRKDIVPQVMTLAGTLDVGEATLRDIAQELERPGRDPRAPLENVRFDPSLRTPGDLKIGAVLPGIVTNVTDFGAFIDVGVHQDGLVHISELAESYLRHPLDAVKVGQRVQVRVLSVDLEKKRISLSRKGI